MSDTIIKNTKKTENFTIVSNEVPKRDDLSARAKGIYFYLMTLPKDWEIHKCEIYEHFTEGRDALDTAFDELMKAGYITKEVKKEKGKFVSFTYTVYEETINGKPLTGKPETVLPLMENPQLLSTDIILSTNKQKTNTKQIKTFTPPTQEEVINYVIEKQLVINPYDFFSYYSKLDWQDNQGNKVKSWKGKAVTWDGRELKEHPDKKPYVLPSKTSFLTKKTTCPRCGSEVIAGLCTKCRTPVDSDGKELK